MTTLNLTISSWFAFGLMALAVGCNKPQEGSQASKPDAMSPSHTHAHGHSHSGHAPGPHDGTMADWGGGKYHVEFTVNHDSQEATVYVLASDEKTPSPIAAEDIQLSIQAPSMQVALKAAPQEGDPTGTSSRFIGTHEGFGVVREYNGTITGVVDGTPYSGDFQEESHAAHEH